MSMRCKSSTHGVYHGAITVPMYQGNDITGGLNTVMSYVSLSSDPLQGYFVRLNLRTKCALSVRITGNVCTYLASFVRGKGTKPKGIGRVWCVRLAVLITAAL